MLCGKTGHEGDEVAKGRKREFTFYEQWLRYNDIETFTNTFGTGSILDSDRDRYMCSEPVIKCTQHHCGCFYHLSCARKAANFTFYEDQHPCMFRCPRHYCQQCKNTHLSQTMAVCVRCSRAYHVSCLKHVSHKSINRKYFLCDDHSMEEPRPPKPLEKKKKRVVEKRGEKEEGMGGGGGEEEEGVKKEKGRRKKEKKEKRVLKESDHPVRTSKRDHHIHPNRQELQERQEVEEWEMGKDGISIINHRISSNW